MGFWGFGGLGLLGAVDVDRDGEVWDWGARRCGVEGRSLRG